MNKNTDYSKFEAQYLRDVLTCIEQRSHYTLTDVHTSKMYCDIRDELNERFMKILDQIQKDL